MITDFWNVLTAAFNVPTAASICVCVADRSVFTVVAAFIAFCNVVLDPVGYIPVDTPSVAFVFIVVAFVIAVAKVDLSTQVTATVFAIVALSSDVAVIVTVPDAFAVITPVVLTVAIAVFDVVQVTVWIVAPTGTILIVAFAVLPTSSNTDVGFMVILVTGVLTTFTIAVPVTKPEALLVAVMVTGPPIAIAVTTPLAFTVAVFVSELDHDTVLSVASTGEIVVVNATVAPTYKVSGVGVTAILFGSTIAAVTVKGMICDTLLLSVAVPVIVQDPAFRPETTPEVLTVAIVLSDDVQVMVCIVADAGLITAVNVAGVPVTTVNDVGVIAIPVTGVLITVTDAVPLTLGAEMLVAVMVTGPPKETPVTTPDASTVAIVGSELTHVTDIFEASVGNIVEVREMVLVTITELDAGVTVNEVGNTIAAVTVTFTICLTVVLSVDVPVIVHEPADTPETTPFAFTVAIAVFDESQLTVCIVAVAGAITAVNVPGVPITTPKVAGVIVIPVTGVFTTVTFAVPITDPLA